MTSSWVISARDNPWILLDPYRKYTGIEFMFNKRFSNRWQFLASYVYGKATGTIDNGQSDDFGRMEFDRSTPISGSTAKATARPTRPI